MKTGVVKFYNRQDGKTYGFITSEDKDYFFFITSWKSEGEPQKGANVTFDTKEGRKGEIAINVKLA